MTINIIYIIVYINSKETDRMLHPHKDREIIVATFYFIIYSLNYFCKAEFVQVSFFHHYLLSEPEEKEEGRRRRRRGGGGAVLEGERREGGGEETGYWRNGGEGRRRRDKC